MKTNKQTIGLQYRKLPPREFLVGIDITTGKQFVRTAECNICKEEKNLSEFYWDMCASTNFRWKPKRACACCWNEDTTKRNDKKGYSKKDYRVKKAILEKLKVLPATLEEFI